MVLTQSKLRLQEDHRKIVEDEDAYFGEEVDDDRHDGIFVVVVVVFTKYSDFVGNCLFGFNLCYCVDLIDSR
jgi:hypothetical protein